MSAIPKVSTTAVIIIVMGALVAFAAIIALPTYGLEVYLTVIYAALVVVIAGLVEQLAQNRHRQVMLKLESLEKKLPDKPDKVGLAASGTPVQVPKTVAPARPKLYTAMHESRTALEWLFTFLGTILAIEGGIVAFLALPLKDYSLLEPGLSSLAVGIGVLALAENWVTSRRTTTYLQEIRTGEIDEKIAMMYAYGGSQAQKIVSDLRALASIAGSVTEEQAGRIETEGRRIVTTVLSGNPTEAAEAREILNSILAPSHGSI